MSRMIAFRYWQLPVLALVSLRGLAAGVDEAPMGEAVERHLSDDVAFMQWVQDAERIARDEGDALDTREILAEELETVKLSNLVPPIHFESGVANIPESTVEELGEIQGRLRTAGTQTFDQPEAECCYARSSKTWVRDPDAVAWETFVTFGQITHYGDDPAPAEGGTAREGRCCA